MRSRFLVLLTLGLSVSLTAVASEGAVEDFIATEMPASGVPGLSYAIVEGVEITSVGAHGVVNTETDGAVTPDTRFGTGSITKSFTALAVMQLVEAGELDLDTEFSQYLDDFAAGPASTITVRQLLSHTSGYSTLQGNASHTDFTGGNDELESLVDGLSDVNPAYGPDERWEYSNTNYQILGRLIEVVSGQQYPVYVESNVLEPVGMEGSFVGDGETYDFVATGHTPWFFTKRPLAERTTGASTAPLPGSRPTQWWAPQGGLVASANDLALFMQMMMNGEDDVLSAEGKELMMRPASDLSFFYGFGWYLDSGDATAYHSGSSPGLETLATMVPSENKAVVVLVNGGSGVGFGETTELRVGITARALGLDYDGEGSRWAQKALFLSLVLLPIFYLLSMIWAWRSRDKIRAKLGEGFAGFFSLWFPLLTTTAAAVVILWLMPNLLGAPLSTLTRFQPDLALCLVATAVFGVLWSVFRLGVAYTGGAKASSMENARSPNP